MQKKIQELKNRLQEVYDLNMVSSLLSWDQSTYMPPGGAPARGRQMALLSRISQEKFIDPAIGKLLDELEPLVDSLPPDSDEASLVKVTRRDYEQAIKVPPEFIGAFFEHTASSYQAWTEARPNNDFDLLRPMLEKTLDLSRELANFFPGYDHIADPLIDYADPEMKSKEISALFKQLRAELVPLVEAITTEPLADDSPIRKQYSEEEQLAFGLSIIKDYGFDFERGRQDKTHHPFMTKFSLGDIRITTRTKEDDLGEALFSTLHESGHGMYEQGIAADYEGTTLASGTSSGVHESQSRLWENIVGRSRGFWNKYYPKLQSQFPEQLGEVQLDDFYRAINKVERSLIRTDADEVTYNLHVMIRFDLEIQLLEGKLEVKDLPEAWHSRYQSDLGIQAPNNTDGVLQDVHWFSGPIGGAFQGYTLGNIMSALFFNAALETHPDIPSEIEQGKFKTLHTWMGENIYQHGKKYTANELVQRVTGGPLTIEPYIDYLQSKYGELYNLN